MSEFQDKEGARDSSAYRLDDIGSALSQITHAVEIRLPIVTEDKFIKDVLPILQHPWSEDNMLRWLKIVKEPMNPLRVAGKGEGNDTVVLFTVPALYPRPSSTTSRPGEVSPRQLIDYVKNENDRGNHEFDHYVPEFLFSIAGHGDITEEVLKPIALILARYDLTFTDIAGKPLYELGPNTGGSATNKYANIPLSEDNFVSNGFRDED